VRSCRICAGSCPLSAELTFVLTACQETIEDAKTVFEDNSCQRMLAKCDQLSGRVSIFEHNYNKAKLQLEASNRRLVEVSTFVPQRLARFLFLSNDLTCVMIAVWDYRGRGPSRNDLVSCHSSPSCRRGTDLLLHLTLPGWSSHSHMCLGFVFDRSNKDVTCSRKLLRCMPSCVPHACVPCAAPKSTAHATPVSNVIRSFP
jgi:hypothetical protein